MKESLLLSYSPELIQSIGEELALPDVKRLRMVCRVLADALAYIVLHKLTFEISRRNMTRGVEMVKTLATVEPEHVACYASRKISIGLLSPAYDRYSPSGRYIDGVWVIDPPREDPPEVTMAEELLKNNLFAAIASLKNVHTVEWKTDERNQPFIHAIIIDALKTLPNLCNIQIDFSKAEVPLEFDLLLGREKISVFTERSTELQQEEIFDKLAKAIAHNPVLTSLNVRGIMHYQRPIFDNTQSLHQLFKYHASTMPPLRLRELRLRSMFVRLDHVTLPHLTHLTTLHLEEIDEPSENASHSLSRRFGRGASAGLSKDREKYESSVESIWDVLRVAGVRLQNITVTSISSSFLDYLSSYSGLIKLNLETSGLQDGESSDAMAARFYDGRLNSHVRSLESLQITASFEGLWCFGAHNVKTISCLTNLRNLGMTIRYMDLAVANNPKEDAIKRLIDMTLECMPNIQSIEVKFASLEMDRNALCGTASMQRARCVYEKMLECVGNYIAPFAYKRTLLPTLTVGSDTVFVTGHECVKPDGINSDKQLGNDTTSRMGGVRLKYVSIPEDDEPSWLRFIYI
ncbi:hypothetical protein JR316_0012222 [Psilocybe cubensis]|uniref:F-box domain-containing protein n=2 Tax=Psilocybe cubensis TaxID=181762 RepID=A0A8H8CGS7_PSICU|nr:hypothetical protein JR316_0012222 [Psilocybe cubensis]KAH9475111.1 hypothetical protein JR316_0012222 [Psilocybe cubensis]